MLVNFPFSSREPQPFKQRPVVVLGASGSYPDEVLFVVMVTSSARRVQSPKAGDILIVDLDTAGLPKPSVVRTRRIWTGESRDVVKVLGQVSASLLEESRQAVRALIS